MVIFFYTYHTRNKVEVVDYLEQKLQVFRRIQKFRVYKHDGRQLRDLGIVSGRVSLITLFQLFSTHKRMLFPKPFGTKLQATGYIKVQYFDR